ncbi:hypothetical protein CBS11350_4123 [Aspergillus niger]|nr:hypothetical protein CBS11350_4123 [Aspergillus niger]
MTHSTTTISSLLNSSPVDLTPYEDLYKYFHAHPELSRQEKHTSEKLAAHLTQLGVFDIHTHIGGYGLAGVFRNVTDEDKPHQTYHHHARHKGNDRPVMHACGHDMHITCLLAAAETLVKLRDAWSGTLIVLFQPDEERGGGAQAMVDDGLYSRIPVPDVVLGQHVMRMRAGSVASRVGAIMAAADSMKITVFGRGGHGSQPHQTVDPVLLAAHIVVRLQSIVSREINPSDLAVLTVGSLQAGQTENIIADRAEIGVDFRSVRLEVREQIIAGIKRIVQAECAASGSPAPPVFTPTRRFPPTVNDGVVARRVAETFGEHFEDFDPDVPRTNIAEDFSTLATCRDIPSCFWLLGGVDQEVWDRAAAEGKIEEIPGNHSALFAPVVQPTLRTGVDALCLAALTFLRK